MGTTPIIKNSNHLCERWFLLTVAKKVLDSNEIGKSEAREECDYLSKLYFKNVDRGNALHIQL